MQAQVVEGKGWETLAVSVQLAVVELEEKRWELLPLLKGTGLQILVVAGKRWKVLDSFHFHLLYLQAALRFVGWEAHQLAAD